MNAPRLSLASPAPRRAVHRRSALLLLAAFAGSRGSARAEEAAAPVAFLPAEVLLRHANDSAALVLEEGTPGHWTGDLTRNATITSLNPDVAIFDASHRVRAKGNGVAKIVAELPDGRRAEARVVVEGLERPFQWSFAHHVQPVLFKGGCNTGACHGAAAGKNGFRLSLRGYDHALDHAALTRQAAGRRVSLAEPDQSLILLKGVADVTHGGGERFSKDSEEYARLFEWVRAGAPGHDPAEPAIDRIEVTPDLVTLPQGGEQQFLVRAFYSDGTSEDVTRYAKFGVSEDTVASVADEGLAKVIGPGASAITVWYSSKVAFSQINAPREAPVDPALFASAERRNFIDDLVLDQLRDLNIPPAGIASDADFIRRAYLDATGTLPPSEEVLRFTLSPAPDKRAKLVDRLLETPEFADYWAYKWSDVFLLSSRNLTNRSELLAFYRHIRTNVEANTPWDEFARGIVTSSGNSLENGGVNYYVMHNETIDLTETTSQAFLGMSITCARCHNHPLEKWTQDDYYGFANLLSRVKLKNSTANGGTFVQVDDFQDIAHPRLGRPVDPRPLDGDAIPMDAPGDRREALADWLVSPDNPYFTRAFVNRVWKNYMGRGLVEPVDDLRLTNPPTNGKLLAALAEFVVEKQYDLKELTRAIMNSAAYQRSSEAADPATRDDRYYSQYIARRLPAEVILDAYSQVTGVPTEFPGYPKGRRALQLPDSQVASYFLDAFGRPERKQTCSCERAEATSVAQTLHVANGETLNAKLRAEESAITALVEKEPEQVVRELYLKTLARHPDESEKAEAVAILASAGPTGEGSAGGEGGDGWKAERRAAIEDLAWALLGSKEFLFNH